MKNELRHSHLHENTPNEILKAERELEIALNHLNTKVGETASTVEKKVQNYAEQAANTADSISGHLGTLQTQVETTFSGVDEAVDRISDQFQGWIRIGDEFSGRIDRFIRQLRDDFDSLMSQAEDISKRMKVPVELLAKNPNVAGPALLIAGMVFGIFFRSSLQKRTMVNGHTVEREPHTDSNPEPSIRKIA